MLKGVPTPNEVLASLVDQGVIDRNPDGYLSCELMNEAIDSFKKLSRPKRRSKSDVVGNEYYLNAGPDDESEAVLNVPLQGGITGYVSQNYLRGLQELFPKVDVHGKLLRAVAWCAANNSRKKTPAGLARFLTNWILRDAERTEIRNAVLSAENSRNGFGQGVNSVSEVTTSTQNPDDDFGLPLVVSKLQKTNVSPKNSPNNTPDLFDSLQPIQNHSNTNVDQLTRSTPARTQIFRRY